MRGDRTETFVEVERIDLTSIEEEATATFNSDPSRYGLTPEEGEEVKARISHGWGFVDTPAGMYVFCDEGVGSAEPVEEETFDLHAEYLRDGDVTRFGIMPVASTTLSAERIRELGTGEKVNLREFVRTFGSRLDANYSIWRRVLERALRVGIGG